MIRTRRHDGPNAFEPTLSALAFATLSHLPVDHYKTNCLFGNVVGWLQARRCQKFQIALAVIGKPCRKIASLLVVRNAKPSPCEHLHRCVFQLSAKAIAQLLTPMNHTEHVPDRIEQATRPAVGAAGGVFVEKTQLTNQVRETELDFAIGQPAVLVVRTEVIATDDPVELFSENIEQHAAASGRIDLENGEVASAEAPCPHSLAAVAVPGFVDVQDSLGFQLAKQFFVERRDRLADFGDDFGQQAARKLQAVDVAKILSDGRQRGVAGTFEEADNAGEFDAAESGFADLRRDCANVHLVASGTVAGERLMLGCFGAADNFDLLHDGDGILGVGRHRSATTWALLEGILREPVQFIFRHRRSNRPLMPLLAALFAFASRLSTPDRFDDVRRWGFGAVGGVFRRGGEFGLCFGKLITNRLKLPLQLLKACFQFGKASLPAFTVQTSISRAHDRRFYSALLIPRISVSNP